jgi:hypothetical protein
MPAMTGLCVTGDQRDTAGDKGRQAKHSHPISGNHHESSFEKSSESKPTPQNANHVLSRRTLRGEPTAQGETPRRRWPTQCTLHATHLRNRFAESSARQIGNRAIRLAALRPGAPFFREKNQRRGKTSAAASA